MLFKLNRAYFNSPVPDEVYHLREILLCRRKISLLHFPVAHRPQVAACLPVVPYPPVIVRMIQLETNGNVFRIFYKCLAYF